MTDKTLLVKHNVINDLFDYSFLEHNLNEIYSYFENKFVELYELRAKHYQLNDYCFYIKNGFGFNAFAKKIKGYNIIGITNGYAILSSEIFNKNNCKFIFSAGLKCDAALSNSFAELEERIDFSYSKFMMDCSISFTFGHEFQHILQFNSDSLKSDYSMSENTDKVEFSMQKHAWEFDADRFGILEVIKYAFEINRMLKTKDSRYLKCLIYVGVSSIIITRLLFYFNIIQNKTNIRIEEFYTKKYSHPHPLIRIFNILEYSVEDCKDSLTNVKIEMQEMLNNTFNISNIFLTEYIGNKDILKELFDMIDLDKINHYNNELYDYAINDKAIRTLLKKRNINFD